MQDTSTSAVPGNRKPALSIRWRHLQLSLAAILTVHLTACNSAGTPEKAALPMYVTGSGEFLQGDDLAQLIGRVAQSETWESYQVFPGAAPENDIGCRAEWRIEHSRVDGGQVSAEVRLTRSRTLLASATYTSRRGGPKHRHMTAAAVRYAWREMTEMAAPILEDCRSRPGRISPSIAVIPST
jgi:hypothetical protein